MSGSEVQKDMPACIKNSNLTASRVIITLRTFCSEASPTIWSCNADLNHYLFLYKLIPYLVHKNRKICIARMGMSGIRMLRRVLQGKVATLQYFTSPSCPMDLNRCVICMSPCPLNYFLIILESIRLFSFSSRWNTKCCFLNEPNSVSWAICLARLLLLTADTVAVRFWYVYFINNWV